MARSRRATAVPDIVAFRVGFPVWLHTLSAGDRRIGLRLASDSNVVGQLSLTPRRISQLDRSRLH
jgi:hypothetical protein